jgi:hypothetical protein
MNSLFCLRRFYHTCVNGEEVALAPPWLGKVDYLRNKFFLLITAFRLVPPLELFHCIY